MKVSKVYDLAVSSAVDTINWEHPPTVTDTKGKERARVST